MVGNETQCNNNWDLILGRWNLLLNIIKKCTEIVPKRRILLIMKLRIPVIKRGLILKKRGVAFCFMLFNMIKFIRYRTSTVRAVLYYSQHLFRSFVAIWDPIIQGLSEYQYKARERDVISDFLIYDFSDNLTLQVSSHFTL